MRLVCWGGGKSWAGTQAESPNANATSGETRIQALVVKLTLILLLTNERRHYAMPKLNRACSGFATSDSERATKCISSQAGMRPAHRTD
jgi:hypothetical protein